MRRPLQSARLEDLGLGRDFSKWGGGETGEAPLVAFGDPSLHSSSGEPDVATGAFPASPTPMSLLSVSPSPSLPQEPVGVSTNPVLPLARTQLPDKALGTC